jgi:hypothetical protein
MIRLNAKIERKFGNGCCGSYSVHALCELCSSCFPRMSGRGFDALQKHFAPLQIQADERDARFLAGGNFFGREGER